jgi:Uma2 family endonuclease
MQMSVINPAVVNAPPSEATPRVTGEELFAMGNIGPCELVEGEIIKMSPTGEKHGIIEFNLGGELRALVRRHQLGRVSGGEVGIYTRRHPDSVRGAEIVFISNERLAQRGVTGFMDVAPDLVVEIMSPDDRWNEVMRKLEEYLGIGVRLVWIVDPETESVFAYRSMTDVRRFEKNETLTADDVLPGFAVPVEELFSE